MRKYIISIVAVLSVFTGFSQVSRTRALINASLKNWEIELRAGYNLGGVAPLPLPQEIRKLESYSPTLPFSVEADFTKRFGADNKWGVLFGVKIENKNMDTKANVKNYNMEIVGDGGEKVSGRWTGGVQTSVRNSYLTFPVLGVYRVHPRTNVKLGVFLSYMMEGKFEGYVYDGYLREGDPTGLKVEYKGDDVATYDFSEDLRSFQWGVQAGVDWKAFKHLKLYADLAWGLNNVFHSGFKTIAFDMHPIYLNLGVGYIF